MFRDALISLIQGLICCSKPVISEMQHKLIFREGFTFSGRAHILHVEVSKVLSFTLVYKGNLSRSMED